jgi:hypothetical protein
MSLGVAINSFSVDQTLNRLLVNATVGGHAYLFAKDNVVLDPVSYPPATLAAAVNTEYGLYAAAVAELASQSIKVGDLPDLPTVSFGATPVSNSGYGQVSITATVYSNTFTITMSTQDFIDWSLVTNPPFTQRVAQQLALLAKQVLYGELAGYAGNF